MTPVTPVTRRDRSHGRRAHPAPADQIRYLADQLANVVGRITPKQDRAVVASVGLALLLVADEIDRIPSAAGPLTGPSAAVANLTVARDFARRRPRAKEVLS